MVAFVFIGYYFLRYGMLFSVDWLGRFIFVVIVNRNMVLFELSCSYSDSMIGRTRDVWVDILFG